MEYNQPGLKTGLYDEKNVEIQVGDILEAEYGFYVYVSQDKDGDFYGSLICEIGHSCRNIPYALNGGRDYLIVNRIAY